MPRPQIQGRRPVGVVFTSTNADNTKIGYAMSIRNLSGAPTLAHFHVGPRGQNGPVVANLLGENGSAVSFAGFTFITGELDAEDVLGPLANGEAPFDNLLANLATRNIYVNIHTESNPAGEVRAQLR